MPKRMNQADNYRQRVVFSIPYRVCSDGVIFTDLASVFLISPSSSCLSEGKARSDLFLQDEVHSNPLNPRHQRGHLQTLYPSSGKKGGLDREFRGLS